MVATPATNGTEEPVVELARRYITESVSSANRYPEFTMDEVDRIREYVNERFSPADSDVLFAFQRIEGEWVTGHRCGVCGMTTAQSEAANYDCSAEC